MAVKPRTAGSRPRREMPRVTVVKEPRPADASVPEQPKTPSLIRSALGSTLSGIAITVLLVIPALMEFHAAHWNSSYAFALAQLVPPTTLGIGALVPLLPGITLGVILGTILARIGRWVIERPQGTTIRRVAYRLRRHPGSKTTTWEPMRPPGELWWIVLLALTLALIGLLGWFTANGSAPSLALAALASTFGTFMVVGVPEVFQVRRPYTFVTGLAVASAVLCAMVAVWSVATAVNPFPFATFQPTSTNHTVEGQLVRTTDTGVWILTNHGQPTFYTGPLDTLTICGREFDFPERAACQP